MAIGTSGAVGATDVPPASAASTAMQLDSGAHAPATPADRKGEHSSAAAPIDVHEGFANLLKHLGGSSGAASLYAAGTANVDLNIVDPAAASRAALQVLAELKSYSSELANQANAQ